MQIIYIDKNGKYMNMESDESEIVLPVLCKQYSGYQSSIVITVNPGIHEQYQIKKAARKNKENMQFTHMELRLEGPPSDINSWKIYGQEQLQGVFAEMFGGQWISRIESWHRQYCMMYGLTSTNSFTGLSDTFYLTDAALGNVKNCTVHLFGTQNKVWLETLSNVLLYVHGECDGV